MMQQKKISQFLSELDYAGLYDSAALGHEFREQTGEEPCWHHVTGLVDDYQEVILTPP
jgi:hypothetical protein